MLKKRKEIKNELITLANEKKECLQELDKAQSELLSLDSKDKDKEIELLYKIIKYYEMLIVLENDKIYQLER